MKWLGWLVKLTLTTAVITAVSVTVTWSMINIYVEQLLKPLLGDHSGQPIALKDIITFLAGPNSGGNSETETNTGAEQPDGSTGRQQGTNQGPYSTQDAPASENPPPQDALPVMGNVRTEDEMVLSTEDLDVKKDSISSEDRMEIFKILMAKLPPEEMQNISMLMEGGITSEEIQQAAEILKEHLNQEEYERLIGILMKY